MAAPKWALVVRWVLVLLVVGLSGCLGSSTINDPTPEEQSTTSSEFELRGCRAMALAHSVSRAHAESLLPVGFSARDEIQVYYPNAPASSGGAVIASLGIECGEGGNSTSPVALFGYGVVINPPIPHPASDAPEAINDVYIVAAGATDESLGDWLETLGLPLLGVQQVSVSIMDVEAPVMPTGGLQEAAAMTMDVAYESGGPFVLSASGAGVYSGAPTDSNPTRDRAIRFWTPSHGGLHITDFLYSELATQGAIECESGYPPAFDGGQACTANVGRATELDDGGRLDVGLAYRSPVWTIRDSFIPDFTA